MNAALLVGLNPALQRRVELEKLAVGSVNRARSSSSGIGGKGQGAFVASLQLSQAEASGGIEGLPNPRLCMFLGSGREGDLLGEHLGHRTGASDVDMLWMRVASPCRICTTLVESSTGDATEIVEPSGKVSLDEWETLLQSLRTSFSSGGVAALAICGTAPPGVPADGYSQIVKCVCASQTRVVVDSVVDVRGTLQAATDVTKNTGHVMVKLNAREILKLAGQELEGSDSQVPADSAKVAEAFCKFGASTTGSGFIADYVCFTDGPFPGGVIAMRSGRRWKLERTEPLRAPVVSPIGAGDATTAGTLHAWCRAPGEGEASVSEDDRAVQAFRFGLAVGAASCLTGENAVFSMEDVKQIHDSIAVSEV